MSDLRIWNRTVQSATFPSHIFAQAVREWIAAATEMMEPASEPAKVECEEEGKWTGNVKCPDCGRLVNEAHCGGPNHVYQRVRPAQPEPVAHEDAEFMRAGALAMARIIERDEKPEPVAEVKGVRFEDWPAAQERAIAEIESRPQVDGGQRIGGNKPEPDAAEMPEAVYLAVNALRQESQYWAQNGVEVASNIFAMRADALESFWRTHAAATARDKELADLSVRNKDLTAAIGAWQSAHESDQKEIASLRARVAELEGREILWRELEGYVGASYLDHGEYRRVCEIQKLLSPPIPLPEGKG